MEKALSILFRAKLKGYGIVNYDSSQQRFAFNALAKNQEYLKYDNVSLAKKKWTSMDENGKCDYKIIISGDCLRHEIFSDDVQFQSPNILHNKYLLLNNLASPAMLLRGYFWGEKGVSTPTRSSAITITDATQTSNGRSAIETFARSGQKIGDDNLSDNTYFKKETIGDISYQTRGAIDLKQLQFLSADEIYDRLGFDPDMYEEYVRILSTRLRVEPKLGYYQIKTSINKVPEYGVLFSEDNVIDLVKIFFDKLLRLNIRRSKSFAEVVEVEYQIVYNPYENKFTNENDWIKLTPEGLDALSFKLKDYYEWVDYDEAKLMRIEMETKLKELKAKHKIDKEESTKKAAAKRKGKNNIETE